jgi:beta-lactamase regulating signal transducer with metallopeptidase domain
MIAEWMLYSALCAIGLFAAAGVIERWLLGAGAQIRHVWTLAMILSLAIPAAAYWLAPRRTITISAAPSAALSPDELGVLTAAQPASGESAVAGPTYDRSLLKLVPTNRAATATWAAFSGVLAIYFIAGLAALGRMRRRWRTGDVCGVEVLISERTGPAVINPFSPQIVVPEWALAMERHQLGLMIRHEQEHRRAGDPQLLAFAQVALIAMPWNPALWWGVTRLRMAVELDCDGRVLRTADPRTYGDLLLEVARPRRGPRLVAAAAFAERAGGLERRIRAIASRRDRVTRGARAGAAVVGLAVIGVAWAAPHPTLSPRLMIAPSTRPPQSTQSPVPALENKKPSELVRAGPEPLETRKVERVSRGFLLPPAKIGEGAIVGVPRPAFSQLDSLIYDRLFTGVTLSADQEIAARLFLRSLSALQAKQDQALVASNVQSAIVRVRLTQERDSSLLSLVSTDADRDLLAARLTSTPMGGGRRGRSSNPTTEIPVGMQMGGPRSGGRGRVSGGDASRQAVPVFQVIDDVMFGILFNGISLSTDQEAAARSTLKTYREKIAQSIPEPTPFLLRLQGATSVVMRPESRDALMAILSNDADREVVGSRIVVEVLVVNRRPTPPAH